MLPELLTTDALFLDFDGTLVEIAPSPAGVRVTPELQSLVRGLQLRLDGAVALISGRPIGDLDSLLAPLEFAAAGEHGAEIRYWEGAEVVREHTLPEALGRDILALSEQLAGTELELKRASASLHYRRAPEHQTAVVAGMRELEKQLDGYALMLGKMVAELKPENVDKGLAIRDLYTRAPFAGRRPVFIGDDVTDESGFVAVNALGGLSVRVGHGTDTAARYAVPDIAAVHTWLASLL
jgi:trehalose 6-phosphate phosphatase